MGPKLQTLLLACFLTRLCLMDDDGGNDMQHARTCQLTRKRKYHTGCINCYDHRQVHIKLGGFCSGAVGAVALRRVLVQAHA